MFIARENPSEPRAAVDRTVPGRISRPDQPVADVSTASAEAFEKSFERVVWRELTDRGWQVDMRVGYAGYRIDLAVRDPDHPGRYMLGIECDGAAYHSAKTARDRDRTRQAVLNGLGWRIERVWSTQWHVNRTKCLSQLERALDSARRGDHSLATKLDSPVQVAPPHPTPARSAQTDLASIPPPLSDGLFKSSAPGTAPIDHTPTPHDLQRYHITRPTNRRLGQMDIYETRSLRAAVEALGEIVLGEGPIVEELALRRLASWFKVQRITGRFRHRFHDIADTWQREQPGMLIQGVFWPAGLMPDGFTAVRTPADDDQCRDIDEIPALELVNGIAHILRVQFGLPRTELVRETALLFGLTRVTARVSVVFDEAVNLAIASGWAIESGDRVTSAG